MCHLYGVTRSGYYAWRSHGRSERSITDDQLWILIEKIYRGVRGTYGSPRIHLKIRELGIPVGRKRVERLMRERGLKARCSRIYRSKRGQRKYYSDIPNRCLNIIPTGPNQVWVGDITYLRAGFQWYYLAVVLDIFSRRIIGYSLSKNKDTALTLRAFNNAIKNRKPQPGTIFHTDRGTEYGAYVFRNRLLEVGFIQSMNRPSGKMTDNAVMESFFHSMKADEIHGVKFNDGKELARCIRSYFSFYNSIRMHSSLGYLSPKEYELKNAL